MRGMTKDSDRSSPLAGVQVSTLRTADPGTRWLLAALRDAGAEARNLASMRNVPTGVQAFAEALAPLSDASHWLFVSPAAVRTAADLSARGHAGLFAVDGPLRQASAAGRVFAPGPGTAAALRDNGVEALIPARHYDSEGLLQLPALASPLKGHMVIVGAPDGRGLLGPALRERGARVSLLHAYERRPRRLPRRRLAALSAAPRPLLIASSGALLDALMAQLSPRQRARLQATASMVVASERLRAHARTLGFTDIAVAASARPADLLSTACATPGARVSRT